MTSRKLFDSPCNICIVRTMCDEICIEGTIHLVEHEDADEPMQRVIMRGCDPMYKKDTITVSSNHSGQFRTFKMEVREGQVTSFMLKHRDPFDLAAE